MLTKRIVCLANSRKLSGRCVAGKETGPSGQWIRPVSSREHEEVSYHERHYRDGGEPASLDIIDVPVLSKKAHSHQQENWLLDDAQHWVKTGVLPWDDLTGLAEPVEPLWLDGDSTMAGLSDQISIATALAARIKSSLRLIHVPQLLLKVFAPGAAFNNTKRRVQGQFTFAGRQYWLWVTDPAYENPYLRKDDGVYTIGESFLTISLGEPHRDHLYKMIAAVMPRHAEDRP